MMQQTIEGSVLIYPRAVRGRESFMGSHVFQGAEMKISFTKEFKEGLWQIDRQLTANEWGRGHNHGKEPYGDQVIFFFSFHHNWQ